MRIWFLTVEFPPFFGGGISTYFLHTVKMFSEKGHQITVFVRDNTIAEDEKFETSNNVRICRFKSHKRDIYKTLGHYAALSFDFANRVEETIKKEGPPDIIECHDYLGIGYFLIHKKKELDYLLKKIPIILSLHCPHFISAEVGYNSVHKFPDFWIGEMERFCIKAADGLISPSNYLIEKLSTKLDIDKAKTSVIPNPFILDKNKGSINSTDTNEMIYLGRIQYEKGLDHLLNLLSQFWDNCFTIPIKIIGGDSVYYPENCSFKDYLIKKYQKYVDQNLIKFEGFLPPEDVYKKIEQTDIVFVPSLFENYPYAVVEGMAHGKIVVASENGGQSEIIQHGKNGFLFSLGNEESFYRIFQKVLELNDAEKFQIKYLARKHIEEFCSYESVYSQKIAFYQNCIKMNRLTKNTKFPFIRENSVDINSEKENLTLNYKSMSTKNLLSVVISLKYIDKYLRATLECLGNIPFISLEIIIVNYGSSTLKSEDILQYFKVEHPYSVINKINTDFYTARNEGARYSNGEFLAFINIGDTVDKGYFEKAICVLKQYKNISFVGSWIKSYDETNFSSFWDPEPPYFLIHNTFNSNILVYKKDDFIKFGMYDTVMMHAEQYESIVRMMKYGYRGIVLSDPLCKLHNYHDLLPTATNTGYEKYLFRIISERHSDFYKYFSTDIFNIIYNNGLASLYDNYIQDYPHGDGYMLFNKIIENVVNLKVKLKDKKIILFGTGKFGRIALFVFETLSLNVAYFLDNNSEVWDTMFWGKYIKNPIEILREDKEKTVVVIASSYFKEISKQLTSLGFDENINCYNIR